MKKTCTRGHKYESVRPTGTQVKQCPECKKARRRATNEDKVEPKPREARKPEHLLQSYRLQSEITTLRSENKSLVRELSELKAQDALFQELSGRKLKPVRRRELRSGLREGTAVALLSDLHVETLVRPEDTPASNVYTLGVADLRISRAFAGIEYLIRKEQQASKVRELELWLGGDMITNHIHPENVETAQLGPAPATMWVEDRLCDGIRRLLDSDIDLERINIPCSYGNHGRTTKLMRCATGAAHSWEWLMYQSIAKHFRDEPRVQILADRAEHQFHRVYDFDLHFHHGHRVKGGGGVGGITIPMNKKVDAWQKVRASHYHHFGHFHQLIHIRNYAVNGSLIGYDPYAMSIGASPEDPRQVFYLLDSKRGKTACSPVWVGDPSEEIKIWKKVQHLYQGQGY